MEQNESLTSPVLSRRHMLVGTAVLGLIAAFFPMEVLGAPAKKSGLKLTMYRSPSCGCCLKWAEAAQAAGFETAVVPTPDIWALKEKLGVPKDLASCHTSVMGRYVIEGHVPLDAVKRLIARQPNIKGIAVQGMPAGSPGMEAPDGRKDEFQVMAFDAAGKVSVFS